MQGKQPSAGGIHIITPTSILALKPLALNPLALKSLARLLECAGSALNVFCVDDV